MLYIMDTDGCYVAADDEEIILEANRVYDKCFKRGAKIESPENAEEAIKLKLVQYPYEVFACLFLDNRHCILGFEEIFRGTIDSAAVHPREIVREALNYNAAAVIFAQPPVRRPGAKQGGYCNHQEVENRPGCIRYQCAGPFCGWQTHRIPPGAQFNLV